MINKLDYITFLNKYKDLVENEDWEKLFELKKKEKESNPSLFCLLSTVYY